MAQRDGVLGHAQKRRRIQPRAWVTVQRTVREPFERRNVRVSEHDELSISIRGLDFGRGVEQPTAAVARCIVPARVRAPVCEWRRQVGMNPTKRFDR